MNAPIASIRQQVSSEEWEQRVHLAACYRLAALNGWDDLVFTHISARVPGPEHHHAQRPLQEVPPRPGHDVEPLLPDEARGDAHEGQVRELG